MSDIKNLHRAYAAVYDSEIKENLKQSRDEISAMSLTQMNDVDLYEVAEEVLEEVFAKNSDIVEAEKLIEAVFRKASEGVESEGRADKIERLGEAFVSAFARVKEKSIRTAVESYSDYRRGKEIIAKRNDDPNNDLSRVRLHNALVAEDRKVVKSGLLSMIESIGSAIDKTLGAAGEVADTAIKLPAKGVGYLKGLKKGLKKAAKGAETKAAGDASPKNESTVHGTSTNAKGEKIPWKVSTNKDGKSTVSDKFGSRPLNPVKREEQLKKRDKLFGSPKNEAYTVTRADIKANTPAAQGLKSGKKNVKTGEPLYKAADHLKKEELEAVFSEAEIKNILWTDFDENYQAMRNPEKAEAEAKKADKRSAREKRMADPEKGINSPAFREFMRSRGM